MEIQMLFFKFFHFDKNTCDWIRSNLVEHTTNYLVNEDSTTPEDHQSARLKNVPQAY